MSKRFALFGASGFAFGRTFSKVIGAGLLGALLLTGQSVKAQDFPRPDLDMDVLLQELFQQQESDLNYEDFYETLFQYYRNPINLNNTTKEELSSLYVVSEAQVNSFFAYQAKYGKLLSIYELQAIPGFDLKTIYRLMPFVSVLDQDIHSDKRSLFARIYAEDNNSLILRYQRTLEGQKGYTPPGIRTDGTPETRYLGSPDKLYARYRIAHSKDFSLGFTAEKDAGEEITWDPITKRYGADFYSAHFQLYNKGHFKAIALGDYQVMFGQGLLMSSGFAVGKGSETINTLRRAHLGIRPYTSVQESLYLRGGAVTYNMGQWDLTVFGSRKNIDRTLSFDSATYSLEALLEQVDLQGVDLGNADNVGSVQIDGFHRTPTEIISKHTGREIVAGGNLTYTSKDQNLKVGLTAVNVNYNAPIVRRNSPYNYLLFNGRNNLAMGVHYSYGYQNFSFFGETARSQSGGIGTINGVMASLSPKVDAGMVFRNYQADFHTLYGNAFGENTLNINERGIYWGIKVRPHGQWEISAYYDRFMFPWLRSSSDGIGRGDEWLTRVAYRPSKTVSIYGQVRLERKERNQPGNTSKLDYLTMGTRGNYLVNVDYRASQLISLKSRVQWSSYEQNGQRTQGYAIFQDLNFDGGWISISTRYELFDTDNDIYNRQYTFEKDVLYAFSVPGVSGRGTRTYLLLQERVNRNIDVWFKIARTHYRDRTTVGSGLEEISGNKRTDLRVQVRYKF